MTTGLDINVDYCVVELVPKRRDKESDGVYLESGSFTFQSSQCCAKINYGWENRERVCRLYVKSQPALLPKFYATIYIFRGSRTLSYPKKIVQDPSKYIWCAPFTDIEKEIPGAERWNISFKIIFQTENEVNFIRKSYGDQFVQTCINETDSLAKLATDFERLLDGDSTYYDITLKCGNLVIRAHKAVLFARSEFFRKKLKSLRDDKIILQNIEPAVLDENVRYIYTGKLPDLNSETAERIYKTGDIWNTEFREQCVEFLIDNLTIENACYCLTFADDEYFKGKVIDFIIKNKIPYIEEQWRLFCDLHPKSANDVYYELVKLLPQPKL